MLPEAEHIKSVLPSELGASVRGGVDERERASVPVRRNRDLPLGVHSALGCDMRLVSANPRISQAYLLEETVPPCLSEAERIALTARCRDADAIPKVANAGEVVTLPDSTRIQIMHNGIKVLAGSYYGAWSIELISRCQGHHEPQEELSFYKLLPHVKEDATMLEIGAYWSYYSIWFLLNNPNRRAIAIEPSPHCLEIGRRNAALNGCDIEFVQGFVGGVGPEHAPFDVGGGEIHTLKRIDVPSLLREKGVSYLDILHCDGQGCELDLLVSCANLLEAKKIGFVVLSTHILPELPDPLLHQRCLEVVKVLGGTVLAEHDVHESFSADGQIVAYFGSEPIDWEPLQHSRNGYSSSFFRNPLYDLALERKRVMSLEDVRKGLVDQLVLEKARSAELAAEIERLRRLNANS